jgi:hypothetical protein
MYQKDYILQIIGRPGELIADFVLAAAGTIFKES